MSRPDDSPAGDEGKVVFRDKRRLDPVTGAVREGAAAPAAAPPAAEPATEPSAPAEAEVEAELIRAELAGLTDTLQRVQAEYANYRKRVDRDRQIDGVRTTAALLVQLLPLLDDIDRARHHGDLTGGFKGVGEGLEALTTKLGLERYGAAGEPFDPNVHEAVMQAEADPTQSVATCAQVLQPGFQVGGLVLRPARVSVAEGGAAAADTPATAAEEE